VGSLRRASGHGSEAPGALWRDCLHPRGGTLVVPAPPSTGTLPARGATRAARRLRGRARRRPARRIGSIQLAAARLAGARAASRTSHRPARRSEDLRSADPRRLLRDVLRALRAGRRLSRAAGSGRRELVPRRCRRILEARRLQCRFRQHAGNARSESVRPVCGRKPSAAPGDLGQQADPRRVLLHGHPRGSQGSRSRSECRRGRAWWDCGGAPDLVGASRLTPFVAKACRFAGAR